MSREFKENLDRRRENLRSRLCYFDAVPNGIYVTRTDSLNRTTILEEKSEVMNQIQLTARDLLFQRFAARDQHSSDAPRKISVALIRALVYCVCVK